jgi:hypothetical protein
VSILNPRNVRFELKDLDGFLANMFLLLVIKVSGCLHKQANEFIFFIDVSIWHGGVKGTGSLPLSILHIFYNQRVPVMLQRVHATSLLKHAIAIGEGSSKLGILAKGPPFSLFISFS